jgi:transcription elongation factor Elf1
MIKKDKIFELKIEEDDELSGVDAVSLVDDPAIEINWVAFNKTHEDFVIPDGEDMNFSSRIIEKGQSEQDLFDDGYEMVKEEFVSSQPNSPSFEDTEERLIRYKYVLNPQAPGAPIKETTREFCKDLLSKNLVYRVEDLEGITNDLGSSALVWRGSYNCRHLWQKIEYRRGDRITNKGSVTKGRIDGAESYDVMDLPQADTRVPGKASFGYEDSLPPYVDEIGKKIKCEKCGHEWDIKDGGEDTYVCHICGYDTAVTSKSLVGPTMFESYSDYPDSVKNNAKAVLKYAEENGWGSCGTPVGKTRANQLANGEPISLETVKRMYSYLSRHEVDLESSKGYGDGCGKLMYDSWGGKSALSWAKSKINQADKMSKQYFQIDNDEKRIILGPAMVPDQKIFRKDNEGNPYYVFFSPETIRMIAEKYMKNQYTRNNDLMHDGKAVRDVYVIESWIKEDENDKSIKYGYEDLPIGTWMIAMKIAKTPKGDEVWNKVKEGELNGFSVSGFFSEEATFTKEEMFLYKVAEVLKKY